MEIKKDENEYENTRHLFGWPKHVSPAHPVAVEAKFCTADGHQIDF